MSDTITEGIRVQVRPSFVPEQSNPKASRYFFAYEVTISNVGTTAARLVSRHWIITDGSGQVEEVRGPGVIGQQPRLEPGQQHRYVSFCPLGSPVGSMAGSYQMRRDDGTMFEAKIAPFTLAVPYALN